MVLCGHCTRDCPETIYPKFGSVCCGVCGKVCRDNVFIDGDDVKGYLNTKQEYLYKKIIWKAMNKDFLQEQAEKERYGTSKKSLDKRRRQQRSKRDTNANAATAAAEATTEETRTKKRLSSKINYNALDKLFDEEDPFVVPSGKRTRVESRNDSDERIRMKRVPRTMTMSKRTGMWERRLTISMKQIPRTAMATRRNKRMGMGKRRRVTKKRRIRRNGTLGMRRKSVIMAR
ncbi:hypothetical protein C3L33_08555, partial [Rhododendron williamsianum]